MSEAAVVESVSTGTGARRGAGSTRDAALACLAYAVLTIALTWPVARGLGRDVPADLGDPLLATWILSWDARHLLQALGGHPGALSQYWHPGIFYPHAYALAYSEHLTAQALQTLPFYAVTGNGVLCYDLAFLSTFVLSALGMFLFVRELTGHRAAAFVAGLAFGFAPYRFDALPHVQVLSSQWMPFVLYGLRRFFDTGKTQPLVWASLAWLAQNLSCGYYLLFFSPVVAAYVVWELSTRRSWNDWRTVARLVAAAAAVGAATAPFMLPYLKLRSLGFDPRALAEVDFYSADVWAYLTAGTTLRLWGHVARAWPQAEGSLFPGLTTCVLAAFAVRHAWPAESRGTEGTRTGRVLVAAVVGSAAVVVAVAFGWRLYTPWLRITSLDRTLAVTAVLAGVLLAASARLRRLALSWLGTPAGFFSLVALGAAVLSLGPHVHARGRLVSEHNLYDLFYRYVPGFDGLRVPARFAMIVTLALAALAGFGTAALARGRRARTTVVIAGALILIESIAVPLPVSTTSFGHRLSGDAAETPPIYRFLATLPPDTVVLELPLGRPGNEVRYMLHALEHDHPIVNGYSGGEPLSYGLLREALADEPTSPERSWSALAATGATHVVLHRADYEGDRGAEVEQWLRGHGARELFRSGTDRVFDVRHHS
ncbi:MAG: hypothetical protein ACM3SQ_05710 [Betaproteobacteria bacterium]